ncbi:MAG: cupin domain-containing protein [Candidatus Omnitrophota bacterium]|nr:cupin domain-containing protein [Candidatus Omnitrophota bacterium]
MADLSKSKIVKLVSGSRYQRLFSEDLGTCGIKAGHVILKKGEEIGEHSTNDKEEVLIILKGKGQLVIDREDCLDFEGNAVLYVPPQTAHNVKNAGNGILKYIFITSNAK